MIHHSTTDNQFSENGSPKDIVVFKKYGLKIPYILSVANALPHKYLDGLLNGCVLLAQRGIKFELVLAGAPMKFHKKLRELIDSSPIFDRVKLLGYVPDSDLPALYRGATVYVFPSIFEGFGVPLIEAMITGIPVLAANRGALPEIAGGAAMLVDPDPQNLAKGLQKVLSDQELRSKMRNQGTWINHRNWQQFQIIKLTTNPTNWSITKPVQLYESQKMKFGRNMNLATIIVACKNTLPLMSTKLFAKRY